MLFVITVFTISKDSESFRPKQPVKKGAADNHPITNATHKNTDPEFEDPQAFFNLHRKSL